jgi:putative chitinase
MHKIYFNPVVFFNEYKKIFGGIKLIATVDSIWLIIEAANTYNVTIEQLAYILATAYHETGFDFIPKYEYGKLEYFVRKYWLNSKVAKWLGNDNAQDAFECRGRGLVQITGENNYTYFGIRNNPDAALEINKAIEILYKGMLEGIFTTKKLSKYINEKECYFVSARRVVNGTDCAEKIATYADSFLSILKCALI